MTASAAHMRAARIAVFSPFWAASFGQSHLLLATRGGDKLPHNCHCCSSADRALLQKVGALHVRLHNDLQPCQCGTVIQLQQQGL